MESENDPKNYLWFAKMLIEDYEETERRIALSDIDSSSSFQSRYALSQPPPSIPVGYPVNFSSPVTQGAPATSSSIALPSLPPRPSFPSTNLPAPDVQTQNTPYNPSATKTNPRKVIIPSPVTGTIVPDPLFTDQPLTTLPQVTKPTTQGMNQRPQAFSAAPSAPAPAPAPIPGNESENRFKRTIESVNNSSSSGFLREFKDWDSALRYLQYPFEGEVSEQIEPVLAMLSDEEAARVAFKIFRKNPKKFIMDTIQTPGADKAIKEAMIEVDKNIPERIRSEVEKYLVKRSTA
jgi:hypothetical protein